MYLKIKSSLLLITMQLFISLFLLPSCNAKEGNKVSDRVLSDIFQPVIDTLLKQGVDSAFVKKYISSSNLTFSDRFIKINVTGYLSKTDYSYITNSNSLSKSKEFLKNNLATLKKAEQQYGVPKEIIVAILWVETKFGSYLGNNHLPSVFFSTALVAEEKYIEMNNKVIEEYSTIDSVRTELKKKVIARSKSKSQWAIKELLAMAELEKTTNLDFDKINGSWAGAFGIPQFLPTSYKRSATDGNGDKLIDLFNVDDAIFSVGNYLKQYKWNNSENKKKAVFSYNNSNDYAEQIVKLSEMLTKK